MQEGLDCPLYILRGQRSDFPSLDVSQFLKIVLTSAKSVDPDEMQHYAAFHLGLYCLPKYSLRGFAHIQWFKCCISTLHFKMLSISTLKMHKFGEVGLVMCCVIIFS